MTVPTLVEELKKAVGETKVFTPESAEFDSLMVRWVESAVKKAGVVVCPTSNIDVSQTVTLAVKHNVPLAVCGGGHSTGGEASIDGGLLIHLRDLNAVTVSPRDKTITCGGGCRWRDVDQAGAKHGLATLGGTVNDTGIGGLTLGGGYGWLTGQLGIVVDNLLAVEMVLADGRIVTCSATSEPDLFWAVRGAGHAFGVATQFVYRAVEKTEPVFGGMVVFPPLPQNIEHLINFANETHAKGDPRTAMMCGFTSMPRDPTNPRGEFGRAVFAACFYDGPADRAEKIFEPLVKDGPMPPVVNSLHAMPYEKLNGMLEAAAIPGGRRTSKGTVYQPPLPVSVFQRVLGQFEEMAQEIPEVGRGGVCLFEFYHTKTVQRVGFEETAFPHRGSHQNIGFVPQWVDPKHDERMRQFARDAMKAVAEAPEKEGLPAAEYMNYDSSGTPAEQVFGPNYPRLRALKARYDPRDVFAKKHGLGKRLPGNEIIAEAKAIPVAEPPNAIHGEPVADGVNGTNGVAY